MERDLKNPKRKEGSQQAESQQTEAEIRPIKIEHRPDLTNGRTPYEGLYGKYDTKENMQTLYALRPGDDHMFDQLTRIKLIQVLAARAQMRLSAAFGQQSAHAR